MKQDQKCSLQQLIPEDVRERVQEKKVVEAGWAAGPSWVLRKTKQFEPPTDLSVAFEWLEKYRETFRRCHLRLEDKSVLWINRNSFSNYDLNDSVLIDSTEGIVFDTLDGPEVVKYVCREDKVET
jgi:hypothetical protein